MSLASRRAAIERQIGRLLEHAEQLERFPDQDPYQDGDVIRFGLKWSAGVIYTYVAIRVAGGMWYTTATGSAKLHQSWLSLVEWMTSATEIVSFEDMTAAVSVDSEPAAPFDPYGPTGGYSLKGVPIYPERLVCPQVARKAVHEPHRWARSTMLDAVLVCDGYSAPLSSKTCGETDVHLPHHWVSPFAMDTVYACPGVAEVDVADPVDS